jgi:hypothetical protein
MSRVFSDAAAFRLGATFAAEYSSRTIPEFRLIGFAEKLVALEPEVDIGRTHLPGLDAGLSWMFAL